ncbi:MAG: nucleoside kinase [Oscillospiraceae bacterium]|nr:nucleoside kinase [Oscillospiraceae bacterium]
MALAKIQDKDGRYDVNQIEAEADRDLKEFVKFCDDAYDNSIKELAKMSAKTQNGRSVVLISGPSASGKTTTAGKLKKELERMSISAISVSMDNFFKSAKDTPLLPGGERDFESINTMDLNVLHRFFKDIIKDGNAISPHYDFHSKSRDYYEKVTADAGAVIIAEGIHALNPVTTRELDDDRILKVYVAASGEFHRNGELLLSKTELRLIRRLIRDFIFRGSSFTNTMSMWDNVLKGEIQNIKPYKPDADRIMYSTLAYEPYLYKQIFLNILKKQNETPPFTALKLAEKLSLFKHYPSVTPTRSSLVHEFVG